ncbi:MAG: hydantoinase/oxoprolinase family protein [Pseudomonadota bacterium]
MPDIRIGVDVGGTFTDLVAHETVSGRRYHHKQSSTPKDPARAILDGTSALLNMASCTAQDVSFFGHGTTVITNMILEGKGAHTALVTTKGFRDIPDLGRQARPHVYDYRVRRPQALALRRDRYEVNERIAADGGIVTPVDPDEIVALAEFLKSKGYAAVAIGFLHSYQYPQHETIVAQILTDHLDGVFITTSHEVAPEYREFERFTTTTMNARVGPRAAQYFQNLEDGLRDKGINVPLYTITSNAGLVDVQTVKRLPVRTALSGPAAGVGGVSRILSRPELGGLITFDVGGTSTDIAVLPKGTAATARTREIGRYPVLAPMIDIEVIGAGGGSIARLDAGGALTVGPESAGAAPGPASYGLGGTEATVTDAALVLGRIGHGAGLGEDMALDRSAAEVAVMRAVGNPLGLDAQAAAQGIIDMATAGMARTIRSAALSRGHDPARLTLVAYGGAGPLLGVGVAGALGMQRVVVPTAPGTLCAQAILVSDIARDFSETRIVPLADSEHDALTDVFQDMLTEGAAWLTSEGIDPAHHRFDCAIECRYKGQNFELSVPFGIGEDTSQSLRSSFDATHKQTQGFSLPDRTVEAVTFRVRARSDTLSNASRPSQVSAGAQGDAASRSVHFDGRDWPTHVLPRAALGGSDTLEGPVLLEEATSTTVIPPGWTCHVLDDGTLDILRSNAAGEDGGHA